MGGQGARLMQEAKAGSRRHLNRGRQSGSHSSRGRQPFPSWMASAPPWAAGTLLVPARCAQPLAVLGGASITSIRGLRAAAGEQGFDALSWLTARWHRALPAGPAQIGTQAAPALLRPSLPRTSPPAQRLAAHAFPSCPPGAAMAASSARPAVLAVTSLALFLLLCLGPGKCGDSREPDGDP